MLTDLDLNLLLALHALLTEQHVTRAGQRIGLSQPAASAALARLRRYFDDELLVRNGNRYQRTPLAEQLIIPLDQMMALVTETLATRQPFEPRTSTRQLTIQLSDYAAFVLMRPLLRACAESAPGVRLRFVGIELAPDEQAPPADLVVGPVSPAGDGSPPLWTDDWVVAVADDHPDVSTRVTAAELSTFICVLVETPAGQPDPVAAGGDGRALGLQVGARVAGFTGALFMVRGTDWFTLVPRRLAEPLAPAAGVRLLPCPLAVAPRAEHVTSPGSRESDDGVRWLRELVVSVAADLP